MVDLDISTENILENILQIGQKKYILSIIYKWKQWNNCITKALHCRKIYTEKHIWVQSYLPPGKEMGSFRQTSHSVVKSEFLFSLWKVSVLQNIRLIFEISLVFFFILKYVRLKWKNSDAVGSKKKLYFCFWVFHLKYASLWNSLFCHFETEWTILDEMI